MRTQACTTIRIVMLQPTTLSISWQICFKSWQRSQFSYSVSAVHHGTTAPVNCMTISAYVSTNGSGLFNGRMTNTKCVVYFEKEYNGSTVVEDVMIVKHGDTSLTCLKYDDTDTCHEKACPRYHGNADADSMGLETIPTTSIPYMSHQTCTARSRHLNNSRQTCNNSKRTLHSITGLDDLCYCDMNVCSTTANKLPLDVSLAGCVSTAMCLSPQFCRGFLKYANYHAKKTSLNDRTAIHDRATTTVPFLLKVRLVHEMPEWIDFKW